MEGLDTTIAVVALRYIAGGLSATVDDGEWVITSYLAANAIILPITGWLIAHLGRRNYFLLSIAVFTLASGLCGMATGLGELILFRVLQGLAGGGLQPSSQGVLLDAFPVERQGTAMTLFGLAALIAPVVGPTLGGWITDSYSWRWVFWINVPVGLLALVACAITLRDPDYLTAQRLALRRRPFSFDGVGLSLLVIVIVCWEVMLSKGQEWDWLGDPFWRVQALAILFAVGLAGPSVLASGSIRSTRLRVPSLVGLPDGSCSRPAIRWLRGKWPCRRSQTCAGNRRRRSPVSMCSGCWPLSWSRSCSLCC